MAEINAVLAGPTAEELEETSQLGAVDVAVVHGRAGLRGGNHDLCNRTGQCPLLGLLPPRGSPSDRPWVGRHALLTARPSQQGEAETVAAVRVDGYVISYGEVEPGYWGLGVPLDRPVDEPPACGVLIVLLGAGQSGSA